MSKLKNNPNYRQLMRAADESANRYWTLAASDREKGYEDWMKNVKKVVHFIDVFKKKDSNADL